MTAMIETTADGILVESVSKAFGEHKVLDKFTCRIPYGVATALVGVSGCGKSTLAAMIIGLLPCDAGRITGVPEKISAVFQENRLASDFSALSNIFAVTGRKDGYEKALSLLTELGLGEDAKKPVSELSGGMRRRAAIARALAADYDLIILDEPFRELDEKTKLDAMATVREKTAGKTVILITHDSREAKFFGATEITVPLLAQ